MEFSNFKQYFYIIHTCKYFSIIIVKLNCTHSLSDTVAFYENYQLPLLQMTLVAWTYEWINNLYHNYKFNKRILTTIDLKY